MYKINQKYDIDILNYCKLNGIEDVELFVNQCFKQGFDVKKYGFLGDDEKPQEIEVIREIRVEVPVDRIVEKEIIKEIPIEIIKEVIIEKEIPVDRIIEKEVIKEILVDKIVEVPVEIIKETIVEKQIPVDVVREVEVIKEVIVEKPVEIIVTKIEYISDEKSENELLLKIQQLESEISKKDKNLDELRHNLDEVLDKPPIEIIKEVIIEKPVEVIKEVEVEKIITNVEYIRDKTEINYLLRNIEELNRLLEEERGNIKTIEVVKEVQVENNNDKSKMLENTLQNLRKELSLKNDKIKELEEKNKQLESIKLNQGAVFLKGSNLTQNL